MLSLQCIQKKMPFPILIFYSQGDEKLITNFAVPTINTKYGNIIPYSGKFSPGGNFRQFRQSCRVVKIKPVKFLSDENFDP